MYIWFEIVSGLIWDRPSCSYTCSFRLLPAWPPGCGVSLVTPPPPSLSPCSLPWSVGLASGVWCVPGYPTPLSLLPTPVCRPGLRGVVCPWLPHPSLPAPYTPVCRPGLRGVVCPMVTPPLSPCSLHPGLSAWPPGCGVSLVTPPPSPCSLPRSVGLASGVWCVPGYPTPLSLLPIPRSVGLASGVWWVPWLPPLSPCSLYPGLSAWPPGCGVSLVTPPPLSPCSLPGSVGLASGVWCVPGYPTPLSLLPTPVCRPGLRGVVCPWLPHPSLPAPYTPVCRPGLRGVVCPWLPHPSLPAPYPGLSAWPPGCGGSHGYPPLSLLPTPVCRPGLRGVVCPWLPHPSLPAPYPGLPAWPPGCGVSLVTPPLSPCSLYPGLSAWPPGCGVSLVTPPLSPCSLYPGLPAWPPGCDVSLVTPPLSPCSLPRGLPAWPPGCGVSLVTPPLSPCSLPRGLPAWPPGCGGSLVTPPLSPCSLPRSVGLASGVWWVPWLPPHSLPAPYTPVCRPGLRGVVCPWLPHPLSPCSLPRGLSAWPPGCGVSLVTPPPSLPAPYTPVCRPGLRGVMCPMVTPPPLSLLPIPRSVGLASGVWCVPWLPPLSPCSLYPGLPAWPPGCDVSPVTPPLSPCGRPPLTCPWQHISPSAIHYLMNQSWLSHRLIRSWCLKHGVIRAPVGKFSSAMTQSQHWSSVYGSSPAPGPLPSVCGCHTPAPSARQFCQHLRNSAQILPILHRGNGPVWSALGEAWEEISWSNRADCFMSLQAK